jgi:hypothetical protein
LQKQTATGPRHGIPFLIHRMAGTTFMGVRFRSDHRDRIYWIARIVTITGRIAYECWNAWRAPLVKSTL